MKLLARMMSVALLSALCSGCAEPRGDRMDRQAVQAQAELLAEMLHAEMPAAENILILLLTDRDGQPVSLLDAQREFLVESFQEKRAGESVHCIVSGPDLRRQADRDAMEEAMHTGWPADLVDSWIDPHEVDVVISLVPLTRERRPDWPRLVTLDELP